MNTKTICLRLDMPALMHSRLCKLAKITNRSPEWLALFFAESDIENAFEDRDLDFIGCLDYGSEQEAAKVAKVANAFEKRRRYNYQAEPSDECGNFCIRNSDDRAHRTNIILFPAPELSTARPVPSQRK